MAESNPVDCDAAPAIVEMREKAFDSEESLRTLVNFLTNF